MLNPKQNIHMKKIVMIAAMAVATLGYSYAQERGTDRRGQTQQEQRGTQEQRGQQRGQDGEARMEGMTEINRNQLPEQVQNKLDDGRFSEWDFEEAYRVDSRQRGTDQGEYVVIVEKDDMKRKLHFDSNGNLVREEDARGHKGKGDKGRDRDKRGKN
jgi:hypothetical protein